jgi:hypothetical protein
MLRSSVHRGGRTSEVTVQVNIGTERWAIAEFFRFIFGACVRQRNFVREIKMVTAAYYVGYRTDASTTYFANLFGYRPRRIPLKAITDNDDEFRLEELPPKGVDR